MNETEKKLLPLPKIALHDHLDGGLRPATIIDLAAKAGHELPATDAAKLGAWFVEAANSGSLVRYLETFAHTVAVMQTADNLARVAREAVVDLAADGVIYAELRYAPEQHLEQGLSLQQVVEAVQAGIDAGVAEARAAGHEILAGALLTAMRHADRGTEIARLTLENYGRCCVGFDIAGAEDGFPPSRQAEAFALLRDAHVSTTIHAGEAAGVESISEAVGLGAARRIGHGVRIHEDIAGFGSPDPVYGRVAAFVRDNQIPLELCPSSNIQTGAAESIAKHPITELRDLGFTVTINSDNRLMSGTSLTREMALLVDEAGWTLPDLELATLDAAWAAFQSYDVREELAEVVFEAYEALVE